MRIIARFEKGEAVRFVSHLDVQRLFQRAFRRANVPMAYSQGFNPHPQLAFATALAVGSTSSAEWLDVKLEKDMPAESFLQQVNSVLPQGFSLLECMEIPENAPTLTAMTCSADYSVSLQTGGSVSIAELETKLQQMLSGEIIVEKHSKSGLKKVDVRPMIYDIRIENSSTEDVYLYVSGCLNASGSLNVDLLLEYFGRLIGQTLTYRINRDAIYSADGGYLPRPPVMVG